jgi:hypothetical protein
LVETLIKERVSSIKVSPTNVLRPKT